MIGAVETSQVPVVCPRCGEPALPGELFCENCGEPLPGSEQTAAEVSAAADAAPLPATPVATGPSPELPSAAAPTQPADAGLMAPACANCGGTSFADGYCTTCGAPAAKERDHWLEQPASWVAAICDRGIRHHRNEDAVALSALPEPGSRAVLVVCDGVSSSTDSDIASLGAARAARDVLTTSVDAGQSPAGRITHWTDLLTEAARAANEQAAQAAAHPTGRPRERRDSPPSCTFVAAVVDGPLIVVGWVGDSRAYWLPDAGEPDLLSVDDSWAAEQIQLGLPRAEAESMPQAHAITRWLGLDSPDFRPRIGSVTPEGPGWLLVCSDGLWNYCSAAPDMAALVDQLVARLTAQAVEGPDQVPGPAPGAAQLADSLVRWANEQGGMDNISAALARLGE